MRQIIIILFLLNSSLCLWGQHHALEIQGEKLFKDFFSNPKQLEVYLRLDGLGRADGFPAGQTIIGFSRLKGQEARDIKKMLQTSAKKLAPIKNYPAKDLAYSILIIDSVSKTGWILRHDASYGRAFKVYPVLIVNDKLRLAGSFILKKYTYKNGVESISNLGLEVDGWINSEMDLLLRKKAYKELSKRNP